MDQEVTSNSDQAPAPVASPAPAPKLQGKTVHFLGGLPRSGSTLLANVLVQNPRVHVTATSGLLNLLMGVRAHWEKMSEFKAMPKEEARETKVRVLRGIVLAFFANVNRPIILDKGRGWIGQIPFIEALLGRKVKIIVPVRDVRDVIASFEKISTRNPLHPTAQELGNPQAWETVEGRVQIWASKNQPVGNAYAKIKDALLRGFADRLHFVDYDDLTSKPGETLRGVYEFLDETPFEHDFENVEQVTIEDDDVWRMPGLHTIRKQVRPQPPQWPEVIPRDVAKKLPGRELWKNVKAHQKSGKK